MVKQQKKKLPKLSTIKGDKYQKREENNNGINDLHTFTFNFVLH